MSESQAIVILAKGEFPTRGKALDLLRKAGKRICCDGAADRLLAAGLEPDVIIGDLDSLSEDSRHRFADRLIHVADQECNDLTKAVRYCHEQGYGVLHILGATGKREDHSLGNISLMCEYARLAEVRIISDYGEFFLVRSGEEVPSVPGEQFSIFSLDRHLRVSSEGLRYPLKDLEMSHWYTASLNEATGSSFRLHFQGGRNLIVYRVFD